MNIKSINTYFRNNGVAIAMATGSFGLIGGYVIPSLYSDSLSVTEKQKKEILKKDSLRYEKAAAKEPEEIFLNLRKGVYWSKEYKEMNDSLKMDSIIQKAYFEGAQMVRDSIAGVKNNEHK